MTPTEKTTQRAASYMVLVMDGANPPQEVGNTWTEIGYFDAVTAQQAIRSAVKNGTAGETFVAVPARSWKPMTRKVEQVTKESWS
jgi:hypothetical protein